MEKITVNGIDFFRKEIAYKAGMFREKIVIYTASTQDIDSMINRLIDYNAEKKAKQKLKELVSKKIGAFLELEDNN